MITCRVEQEQTKEKEKIFTLSIKRGSIDNNIWVIGKDEISGESYYLLGIDEKSEKMFLPEEQRGSRIGDRRDRLDVTLSKVFAVKTSLKEI